MCAAIVTADTSYLRKLLLTSSATSQQHQFIYFIYLQRICNKFITYIQKNKHIEALNLLGINDIFTLETGISMYKLNHTQLPEIFNPLFKFNNMVRSISTRNKNPYHYPFYSTKSSTQQSIECSGVKVWNALPNDIKSLQSKSLFSSKLKQHLSKPN